MSRRKKSDASIRSYSKTVTIKDVSERAGVSIGTVDRALNNRGRISDATKEKVLQAAKELNYQRNEIARALRVRKNIKLLSIYPTEPGQYNRHFTQGFEEILENLSNFGLEMDTLRTVTLDPQDILGVIGNLEIKNYDGILINAGGPEINMFIDHAVEEGVPVATFNSDSPLSKRLFFCGEDHFAAGRLSGELVSKLLGGSGTVSFFSGLTSVYALKERTRGFVDIVAEDYPNVSIINNINHQDDTSIVTERAEELLFDNPMPDVIFCNSSTGALPICQLLKKHKVKNRPMVIGYEDGEGLIQMLKEDYCTALIFQAPKQQAKNALRFMFYHLYDGAPIPTEQESIIIPTIVLKSNMDICSR